jgi:hypothetical protein
MKMITFVLLGILTGCSDSALNNIGTRPCTMKMVDKCQYKLSNGDSLWMSAYATVETEVPSRNADSECRDAANRHAFEAPTLFSFLGDVDARAADALQPDGSYRVISSKSVEVLYQWTGSAKFIKGDETGDMTCMVDIHGRTYF